MELNSVSPVESENEWVSLMDYAMRTDTSVSTLRRYIKSGKVQFRLEDGKYFLPLPKKPSAAAKTPSTPAAGDQARLLKELQKAHEEIAELKTLIAFYEERLPQPRMDV